MVCMGIKVVCGWISMSLSFLHNHEPAGSSAHVLDEQDRKDDQSGKERDDYPDRGAFDSTHTDMLAQKLLFVKR